MSSLRDKQRTRRILFLAALAAVLGLVADLLSVNRRLLEDLQLSGRLRDWREP